MGKAIIKLTDCDDGTMDVDIAFNPPLQSLSKQPDSLAQKYGWIIATYLRKTLECSSNEDEDI